MTASHTIDNPDDAARYEVAEILAGACGLQLRFNRGVFVLTDRHGASRTFTDFGDAEVFLRRLSADWVPLLPPVHPFGED